MNLIQSRRRDLLDGSGRPANLDAIDGRDASESKVQAALILRTEATASGNFLHLLLAVPEHAHFSADGASIAAASCQV